MFGTFGRRVVETVVVAFALLGFGLVPLGSKTGLEHSLALLQTAPARDAAVGFIGALGKARDLLIGALMPRAPASATDALPIPSAGTAVRPVPPKLQADPARPKPQR